MKELKVGPALDNLKVGVPLVESGEGIESLLRCDRGPTYPFSLVESGEGIESDRYRFTAPTASKVESGEGIES